MVKYSTVKPELRDPLMRDQPAMGDHLLMAVVQFDLVKYTSTSFERLLFVSFKVVFFTGFTVTVDAENSDCHITKQICCIKHFYQFGLNVTFQNLYSNPSDKDHC